MKSALLLFCLMMAFAGYGQQKFWGRNTFLGEFSRWGRYSEGSATLNYEYVILQKGIDYYGRIGGGVWANPSKASEEWTAWPKFNLGIGAIVGKRFHHLDVQTGAETYMFTGADLSSEHFDNTFTFRMYALVGYRYQKPMQPVMFRLAVASYGIASVAIGYAF